jgi:hypothetical protein
MNESDAQSNLWEIPVVGSFEFLGFLARFGPQEHSDPYEDEKYSSPKTKALRSRSRIGYRDEQDDAQ